MMWESEHSSLIDHVDEETEPEYIIGLIGWLFLEGWIFKFEVLILWILVNLTSLTNLNTLNWFFKKLILKMALLEIENRGIRTAAFQIDIYFFKWGGFKCQHIDLETLHHTVNQSIFI